LFVAVLSAQVRLFAELLQTDDIVLNIPVSNRVEANDRGVIANLSMLLHVRFHRTAGQGDREFVHRRPQPDAGSDGAPPVRLRQMVIQATDGLAGALRARGVGPDCRVALCLERSPEMVIGILATLAAGATHVPLEVDGAHSTLERTLVHSESSLLLGRVDAEDLAATAGVARLGKDRSPAGALAEVNLAFRTQNRLFDSHTPGSSRPVWNPSRAQSRRLKPAPTSVGVNQCGCCR
jgi:hypothetical protein